MKKWIFKSPDGNQYEYDTLAQAKKEATDYPHLFKNGRGSYGTHEGGYIIRSELI